MYKLKTHKGAAKRIWKTGAGKLMRRRAARSHHRARKNAKQGLGRGSDDAVAESNPRISELIPYN